MSYIKVPKKHRLLTLQGGATLTQVVGANLIPNWFHAGADTSDFSNLSEDVVRGMVSDGSATTRRCSLLPPTLVQNLTCTHLLPMCDL